MFFTWVNSEDFEDEFLSFADVVTDIANPAGANFAAVKETFFVTIFFKGDVGAVISDFFYCGENKFAPFWPFGSFEGRHGCGNLTPLWW